MTINVTALQETIEAQKRIITTLQHENQWYQDVIFNSGFNEVDIRLMVQTTPREVRMGLTDEAPEKKIYLPALADEIYSSAQTTSVHLRNLSKANALSYRTETDEKTGNKRVIIASATESATPKNILIEKAKRGGSEWENGIRVVVCKCGSTRQQKRTQTKCPDCGDIVYSEWENINQPVEPINTHDEYDSGGMQVQDEDCKSSCVTVDTLTTIIQVSPALAELQSLPQWVCWRKEQTRNGKLTKVPYDPHFIDRGKKADTTNPETWGTYEQAQALYEAKPQLDGIGFVFNGDYTGVDLDKDKETGKLIEDAPGVLALLDSYAEYSPNGGIHIIARGSLPKGRRRDGIEMYSSGRFFTITGDHVQDTPLVINDCQPELDSLYEELAPPAAAPVEIVQNETFAPKSVPEQDVLKKARAAANGAKFSALYDGDITGYPSHSEADQALFEMLLYWTDGDVSTSRGLFEQSQLKRDKWKRDDYRERTINQAVALYEQQRARRSA